MTSETDAEFVADMEWLHSHDREAALPPEKLDRLFALARRGAAADAEIERLRAALREIAKVTRGWEPGVWTEEEGRQYFAALFFGAQKVARAALEGK